MNVSAKSTSGVTIRVAYVVSTSLTFTTNNTNSAHYKHLPGRIFDLPEYYTTFFRDWQAKLGRFFKIFLIKNERPPFRSHKFL